MTLAVCSRIDVVENGDKTYLSDIRTNLTSLCQELNPSHPLASAQPRLASKVMQMHDESFKDILHTCIRVVGIDPDDVLGNVVDVQVHQWRNFDLGRIHVFLSLFCFYLSLLLRLLRCFVGVGVDADVGVDDNFRIAHCHWSSCSHK